MNKNIATIICSLSIAFIVGAFGFGFKTAQDIRELEIKSQIIRENFIDHQNANIQDFKDINKKMDLILDKLETIKIQIAKMEQTK